MTNFKNKESWSWIDFVSLDKNDKQALFYSLTELRMDLREKEIDR